MTNAKHSLLNWLAEGDLLRVCVGLDALGKQPKNASLSGQAALQAGRYRQLRSQQYQNLIDQEDYQHELAKTRQTLLDLIQSLPDDWPVGPLAAIPPSESVGSPFVFPWKKTALVAVAVIGLLALVAQISGVFAEKQSAESTQPSTEIQKPTPADTSKTPEQKPQETTQPQKQANKKEPAKSSPQKPVIPSSRESSTNAANRQTNGSPNEVRQPAAAVDDIPLTVRCKTNKGRSGQYYKSGSTVRLYAAANQPCYLRSLYRLADDRIILLDDNRSISAAEAGKEIQIGSGFVVDEPYGQEEFYVFAQSSPFPVLNVERTADGYDLVKDNLDESLRKTRGLKKKVRFAEDRIFLETRF